MRIFKTKPFARFAQKEAIAQTELCDAVQRAEQGLVDADLGGGVLKQRIARRGRGKSGGFRTIILLRRGERAFFVYGFAKSAQPSIQKDELQAFRKLAVVMLNMDEKGLSAAIENGTLTEINCDE